MNFYHLDVHIDLCYTYESSRYDLVQFGPLNMISQQMLSRVSAILQGISSEDVPFAWWTEFSTWQIGNQFGSLARSQVIRFAGLQLDLPFDSKAK